MARKFEHTLPIEINDNEIMMEFHFTATPVIAATWDDPAEGGEIEISNIIVIIEEKGKDDVHIEAPGWLYDILSNDSDIKERLYESVANAWNDGPDDDRD